MAAGTLHSVACICNSITQLCPCSRAKVRSCSGVPLRRALITKRRIVLHLLCDTRMLAKPEFYFFQHRTLVDTTLSLGTFHKGKERLADKFCAARSCGVFSFNVNIFVRIANDEEKVVLAFGFVLSARRGRGGPGSFVSRLQGLKTTLWAIGGLRLDI